MSDRRTLLADAAIALVAEAGMRGLTHRAVDARAGLPLGTTSAYLRTRLALIEAIVARIAELDLADLAVAAQAQAAADAAGSRGEATDAGHGATTGRGSPAPTDGGPAGGDEAAVGPAEVPDPGAIAALIDHWLTAGRERTLARYACLLEATHRPELRTILAYGDASRAQARAFLAAAGAPDPDRRGDHFVAFVDGLLFDRLIGAGARTATPPGTPESRADLEAAVRAALRGVLADR